MTIVEKMSFSTTPIKGSVPNKSYMGIFKGKITIVDILLALLMGAILVGLYLTTRENISSRSIDAACRKVQSDIRYAQQLAMTTGVAHGVKFLTGGSYEVYAGSPGNPIIDPATRASLVEDLSEFKGLKIASNYHVEFNSEGEPVMGGGGKVRLVAEGDGVRDIYVVEKSGAVMVNVVK